MSCTRKEILDAAKMDIGKRESDGTHKPIIDKYNSFRPLARSYKVKYSDNWCAVWVSKIAIQCGATDIIPIECGCEELVKLAKKMGIWEEADNYTPKEADIILYDWDDSGKRDNVGWSDHIGYVEKVDGKTLTIIEGNYSNMVKRRTMKINGKFIRGYVTPLYKEETETKGVKKVKVELTQLSKGSKGAEVKALQSLLIYKGFSCGTKGIDGSFGQHTHNAVVDYQERYGLKVDGYVGIKTWTHLLTGK